jgi:MFS family permease
VNGDQRRNAGRETAVAEWASEVEWKDPPSWLPSTFHSLAYRDYALLWLGQISNSLALWMDLVARPILVLALTGSAVQLGLISMVRGVPSMFMGPLGGLISDRFDRRKVMLVSKSLSMAVNTGFAVLIVSGNLELWHIYATAVLRSILMAFDGPARQALLPSLVPPRLLLNGIALNTGSMQIVRILSASVAGFLITIWAFVFSYELEDARSFGGVYVITALAYVFAVGATFRLKVPLKGRVERTEDGWITSFFRGFQFAGRNPVILGLLVLFAVQSLFGMPYLQVFVPWLAIKVMKIGAEGTGMLLSISGFGSLAGALILATLGERIRRRGVLIIGGLALYGVALAGLGLTSALPLVAILGLSVPVLPIFMIIIVGLGQTAMMTLRTTLLVEVTPNELRGRVFSLMTLDRGFSNVGSGLGGFAIALMGGPLALALYGGLCAVGAVMVGVFVPSLRKVD